MRIPKIAAALAPLLAVTPLMGQQKPATPPPPPASPPAVAAVDTSYLQLELTGGVGVTAMDLTTWTTNKTGTLASDWAMTAFWGSARLLLPLGSGNTRLGFELGYHHHFWWNQPSGFSWVYYNKVTAFDLAAMIRLPLGTRFTADLGGGFHMFNKAGTHPGVLGALNYNIPAGPVVIPVGVRADAIFADPLIVPIVLNAGVRLAF